MMNRNTPIKKISSTILMAVITMALLTACGSGDPKEEVNNPEIPDAEVIEENEPKAYFQLDTQAISSLKKGDSYTFPMGETDSLKLRVRQARTMMPGVFSISADIVNEETGLATLVIKEDKISGSLDIYDENKLYYVRFDSAGNSYYLEEMDKSDLDSKEGSVPLETPENQ